MAANGKPTTPPECLEWGAEPTEWFRPHCGRPEEHRFGMKADFRFLCAALEGLLEVT